MNSTEHPLDSQDSLAAFCRPHPDEPGTLRQQLQAISLYLDNPWNVGPGDESRRWDAVRRTIMQHARNFYVDRQAYNGGADVHNDRS